MVALPLQFDRYRVRWHKASRTTSLRPSCVKDRLVAPAYWSVPATYGPLCQKVLAPVLQRALARVDELGETAAVNVHRTSRAARGITGMDRLGIGKGSKLSRRAVRPVPTSRQRSHREGRRAPRRPSQRAFPA
jgi:hypothetical protein